MEIDGLTVRQDSKKIIDDALYSFNNAVELLISAKRNFVHSAEITDTILDVIYTTANSEVLSDKQKVEIILSFFR